MNAATLYRDGEDFAELTTESPSSSYGVPVLRLRSPIVAGDFGPADLVPWGCFPGPDQRGGETPIPAAFIVDGWARDPQRSADELALAARFLRQWWREGPQAPEMTP